MTNSVDTVVETPWIPAVESFGARLALVRQRMGWTNVKEAATACGLPAENWRRWERGESEPRRLVTIAMTIATRTGCDYLWLVHGPARGGMRPTTGYAPGVRVLARIGDEPNGPARRDIHRATPTRPVSQTRPIRRSSRPVTPVAV